MSDIFEELGDEFGPIHETVRQYFKGKVKDIGDVEDMTQDVLERICQKSKDLETDTLQNWVLKVSHNFWLNQQKRSQKHDARFISIENIEKIEQYNLPGLEVEVVNKECRENLYNCLRELPDAYKTPIVLHYLFEYSYAEIAEKLGIPLNTLKSRSFRGIKKLREKMSGEKRY